MMKCPRCVQRIHRAAASCPHCGFSLADADATFGQSEIRISCLTDAAGILRRNDHGRVEAAMAKIARRYPQLFVAVHTRPLGGLSNLRQFGFWLLNRSVFVEVSAEKSNAAGILLTIDPESKAAGIVFGYLLDPYLDESDTFACLARGHAYWLEGRYADGIAKCLNHLDEILHKRSRQARRAPDAFARKIGLPAPQGDRLKHPTSPPVTHVEASP